MESVQSDDKIQREILQKQKELDALIKVQKQSELALAMYKKVYQSLLKSNHFLKGTSSHFLTSIDTIHWMKTIGSSKI